MHLCDGGTLSKGYVTSPPTEHMGLSCRLSTATQFFLGQGQGNVLILLMVVTVEWERKQLRTGRKYLQMAEVKTGRSTTMQQQGLTLWANPGS